MKKLVRGAGLAVLSVVILYYVGVNALLATNRGAALFNLRPELAQIHYTRAWTIVPMQLEVEGFELSMQDPLVQISITADRVHGNLRLWTLWQQRFVATHVTADGVSFRVRPRVAPEDVHGALAEGYAPIAGYDTTVAGGAPSALKAPAARYLSLVFSDMTVHHLREVWVDRVRYTGDAEVTGGLVYEPFRRLRIDDGHFVDAAAELVAVAPNELTIDSVDMRVTLPEVDLGHLDLASLRGVVADLKLSGAADPRFLNSYLTQISGLETLSARGAPGRLELDVKIDHGVALDGARLTYQSSKLDVRIPVVEVSGAASVLGAVVNGGLTLDVQITKAALRKRDGDLLAAATRFSFFASSAANLTLLNHVDAELTLEGGRVPLVALNEYIPEGAGVRLAAGNGLVSARLHLDAVPPRARGGFELTSDDVLVKNRSATLAGKLSAHGELHSLDLATGAMNLSGSTVALDDAKLHTPGRTWPAFWLRAAADPCLLTPSQKLRWSTTIGVGASNLQPLLAIVSANVPVPASLSLFTDSPNVRVAATVQVRADSVELSALSLASQNVRVEGAVSLREASPTDPRLEPWGQVVAHAGVFSAGVQFDGPKVSVVLGDLKSWVAKRTLVPTSGLGPEASPRAGAPE